MMSPTDLWADFQRSIARRRAVQAQIDADLATMPEDPSEAQIDAHETRCELIYAQLGGASSQVADLAQEIDDRGLAGEIAGFLAVTYGGRP